MLESILQEIDDNINSGSMELTADNLYNFCKGKDLASKQIEEVFEEYYDDIINGSNLTNFVRLVYDNLIISYPHINFNNLKHDEIIDLDDFIKYGLFKEFGEEDMYIVVKAKHKYYDLKDFVIEKLGDLYSNI